MINRPALQKQLIHAMKSLPQDSEIQEMIRELEITPMPDKDYARTLKFILSFWHLRPDMMYAYPQAQKLKKIEAECLKHVTLVDSFGMRFRPKN
jgi:hypothetical protein